MGTHPIFESDFDCLTDMISAWRSCRPLVTRSMGLSTSQNKMTPNMSIAGFKGGRKSQYGKTGGSKKTFEQERARERRQKEEAMARKKRSLERDEAPVMKIPSRSHPDYNQIGWRWPDVFAAFEPFNLGELVIVESYRDLNAVPKLKRDQLKMTYQPNPLTIKRIAAANQIKCQLGTTTEEHEIMRQLEHIEHNELFPAETETDPEKLKPKKPTIAIMGHVDHGKTSLLDHLHGTTIAEGEAGGITQRIGTFSFALNSGESVTVLDTPGHSAFNHMRERGSASADLIVLVVAADDGIMPQTLHSFGLIKKTNVPFIVAITKIDKPNARPNATRKRLVDDFHVNDDDIVNISAIRGDGMDDFSFILTNKLESLQLKAADSGPCEGLVLETAPSAPGAGRSAMVLIQRGTLKPKDTLLAKETICTVKDILDVNRQKIKTLKPGEYASVTGWQLKGTSMPPAGVPFQVCSPQIASRARAFRQAEKQSQRADIVRSKRDDDQFAMKVIQAKLEAGFYALSFDEQYTVDKATRRMAQVEKDVLRSKSLHLMLKTSSYGFLEAIIDAVDKYEQEEDDDPEFEVKTFDVAPLTIEDVNEAVKAQLAIVNFDQKISVAVAQKIKNEQITLYDHDIIYDLFDALHHDLRGLMPSDVEDTELGVARVRAIFQNGTVAGCIATQGQLESSARFRVKRGKKYIFDGDCLTLKRGTTEVKEIHEGEEFGLALDEFTFQKGDQIECHDYDELQREAVWPWNEN